MDPHVWRKDVSGQDPAVTAKEVFFQKIAAAHGLAPRVLDTDYRTFITMEKIEGMSVADFYGDEAEQVGHIPAAVLNEAYALVHRLYFELDIEYVDVTGYNFMRSAADGKLWIIDFEHATFRGHEMHAYTHELFDAGTITKWNPEFAAAAGGADDQ